MLIAIQHQLKPLDTSKPDEPELALEIATGNNRSVENY
jgi:hypothetical protein